MNIYAFKLAIIQGEKMSLTETNIAREQAERWRSSPLLRTRTCGLFMHIAVGLRLGGGAVSDGVLGPPGQLPHDQGSHNKKPILPPICPLTTTPSAGQGALRASAGPGPKHGTRCPLQRWPWGSPPFLAARPVGSPPLLLKLFQALIAMAHPSPLPHGNRPQSLLTAFATSQQSSAAWLALS